jgi:hypothetical protein
MGAAATANVGSLAAAGGAALSAGVGAVASAASALLPSGDAARATGAIPKRKVSSCLEFQTQVTFRFWLKFAIKITCCC